MSALPARWVLQAADALGDLLYVVDRRGLRAGLQNLDVAFGEGRTPEEKRWILRTSMRGAVRSVFVLLHAAPMTPRRIRRWVDLPSDLETRLREQARAHHGGVVVSGHFGSWELLLGLPGLFGGDIDVAFLVEAITHPTIDRFLAYVRGTGGGASVYRKGGARALNSHVRGGGVAALLVDRNVRRELGGIWVPFLGLPARTSPLPAWLARRHGVIVVPLFCLPTEDGRYRIEAGEVWEPREMGDDEDADILVITRHINRELERMIRARPEAWNWTLKRFKSRPTQELGPYPAYSLWDPARGERGKAAKQGPRPAD